MSKYYYKHTERNPDLFTVGIDNACGVWQPDSDHDTRESAVDRVNYLNGGDILEVAADSPSIRELFFAHVMQGLLSAHEAAYETSNNPNQYTCDQEIIDRGWRIVKGMEHKIK